MKRIALIALLTFSIHAQADLIQCDFTEPFIQTTYSMAQQKLTVRVFGESSPQMISNVSFQIKSPGEFEIVSAEGRVLQKLSLNYKGSNGMSDTTYPYDVQYTFQDKASPLFGGCTSNFLKASLPKN